LWSSRAAGVHGTRCINSFEINLTTYEAEWNVEYQVRPIIYRKQRNVPKKW
jgi:hypothetical protein